MRRLATIRVIDEIRPIENADAIECAIVGGWTVVVQKNEYMPGDVAVYCEIDSWIPHGLAPFLSKGKSPREYNGVVGERLRTIKLRGQLSQGLLLPLKHLTNYGADLAVGADVTDAMGIQKWEAPIPAQLSGQVRGNFPTAVPKTDQERVQNLTRQVAQWVSDLSMWEITEKLDGSSCTMYLDHDNEFHVCSRNLDLKRDENNSFWKVAVQNNVEGRMITNNLEGYAIQGELIGEGIQGNPYGLKGQDFYVFDIYNVTSGAYLQPEVRRVICERLGLKHVPVVCPVINLTGNVETLLKWAEGKSYLNDKTEREGIVFKRTDGKESFKAISNKFLLGER